MLNSSVLSSRARRHLRVALPAIAGAMAIAAVLAFRVTPSVLAAEIRVTPASGPVGTTVQVSGTGWAPNTQVAIFFDNLQIAQSVTTNAGTLTTSFTLPSGVMAGQKQIRAVGAAPSSASSTAGNGIGQAANAGAAATTQSTVTATFTVTATQASPTPTPTATPTATPQATATPTTSPTATPTGTPTPTPSASPTPTPSASPTPSATPSPTPSPTPTPAPTPTPGPPFTLSTLRLDSPCIPLAGQAECEPQRRALWQGERAAWQPIFAANGQPTPTDDEIAREAKNLRFSAGDPAAVAAAAQALKWPHVRINAARHRGREATEVDEWVEIKNHGGEAQDMTGWSVRIAGSTVRWQFAEGFVLAAGQSCKFYTGTAQADPCGGSSSIAQQGVLPNEQGTVQLWVDWLDLKVNEARYHSNPAQQPPPPNLQGYS